MIPKRWIWSSLTITAILAATLGATNIAGAPRASVQADAPKPAVLPPPPRDDPAVIRRDLLARLDRRIDEMAAQSHLEIRLALDDIVPVPYLGVDSQPSDGGLVLMAVYPDTGAERCGLKKGDILRTMAGVPMDSRPTLARAVRTHQIGETVDLVITRDGKPMTLRATLGPRPEEDEDEEEQYPDLIPAVVPPPPPMTMDFEGLALGTTPANVISALGGHGRLGAWKVVKSERGLALRQDDEDPTGIRFPIAVAHGFESHDAVAKVRFRFAGGRVDRAAGLVLRFTDPSNYLVARANAAEADVRIFRVAGGIRRTLPGAIVHGDTDDDRWHTLEFRAKGAELEAILDGTIRVGASDTFARGKQVGLWTKSDSKTDFDDWSVEAGR